MKYFLTYHAVERFMERFPSLCNKIPQLKDWKREKGLKSVKPIFDKMVQSSHENKSYMNNTAYMVHLYEKYGYDEEYCFLEMPEADILFLFVKSRSDKDFRLVTVMPSEYRPSVKNVKYNNTLKKEEKFTKFILDWYDHFTDKLEHSPTLLINNSTTKYKEKVSEESELYAQFLEALVANKTIIIERISNSKCIHSCVIEDNEYEFIYSTNNKGAKEIFLNSIRKIKSHEYTLEIEKNSQLYNSLSKKISDNRYNLIYHMGNKQSLLQIQLEETVYEIIYIKRHNEYNKIVLNNKRTIDFEVLNFEENKELYIPESYILYSQLLELTENNSFTVIEKVSKTKSIRKAVVENKEYTFLYSKSNSGEREFYIHNATDLILD